jgi:hypothetical protein
LAKIKPVGELGSKPGKARVALEEVQVSVEIIVVDVGERFPFVASTFVGATTAAAAAAATAAATTAHSAIFTEQTI